ncbi:prepilin-type N-terminal cleavage/methylation domain-containing protein [uncultured Aquabacterium sp.]|uniref:type IV pilus modification PilV family protein n=1 Tax=Aquabacterium sp. TaxID=1872578 RepID=UPI0025CEBB6B|nr:prepilin-type N-terminal cleavage/methylation domain-containing protein [uncultured Aquabacterium sp.]
MTGPRAHRPQGGFLLIEVLIAILIFAVGILGLVGLQARMTKAQTEAKARADAVNLAGELRGLMWVDIANLAQYETSACAAHAPCANWLAKLQSTLPSGSATVTRDTTRPGWVRISITWQLPNGSSHRYETATVIQGAA